MIADVADSPDSFSPPESESEPEPQSLLSHGVILDEIDRTRVPLPPDEEREFQLLANELTTIPFCPWTPNPGPQTMFLLDFGREALYGGAAGGGKLESLDTVLPTPTGWTTMGEVKAGDWVFTEAGEPCKVLIAHEPQVPERAYRLTFDDGTTIECGGEHLWPTFTVAELSALSRRTPEFLAKRRATRPRNVGGNKSAKFTAAIQARNAAKVYEYLPPPTGTVRNTDEIAKTLTTPSGRSNHAVMVAGSLNLPDIDLPLDPYLLGVWLGDGTTLAGQITGMDVEIFQAFQDAGWELGACQAKVDNQAVTMTILGLVTCLKKIGVYGNKHVPPVYLRASASQRLALLQGLMDTDGTVNKAGSVCFDNTNRRLVEAARELGLSLGHKVGAIREGRAKFKGKDYGPKWSVQWTTSDPVFRLERKLSIQKRTDIRRTTRFRYITSCEPIEPILMRCITVDNPTSLYLCSPSFVPTHNSIAILMAASQFLAVPGYAALILRKSFRDLDRPGALMDIAEEWWRGKPGVRFDIQERAYYFDCPGGGKSRIVFGSLDDDNDRFKYQGGAFSFCGYDELTQHRERDYRYLFSRLRRGKNGSLSRIPIRMRSTANPGGVGHEWVFRRFISQWEAWKRGDGERPTRNFHPALLSDNPKLDEEDYIESLNELDPVTRAQLLRGDWNIRPDGRMFKREWFIPIKRSELPGDCRWVRFWDMASTDAAPGGDPDYTVGTRVGRSPLGRYYIDNMVRWRKEPADSDTLCHRTAIADTRQVLEAMETEPGASGKIALHHYRTGAFAGSNFRGVPSSGKSKGGTSIFTSSRTSQGKIIAAGPVASQADAGNVYIVVDGTWDHEALLSEMETFPDSIHDDVADTLSGAFALLAKMHMYGLDFGQASTGLTHDYQWRPDAMPSSTLARDDGWMGGRIVEEREMMRRMEQEMREERMAVEGAFSME